MPGAGYTSSMLKPCKVLVSSGGGLQHIWSSASPAAVSSSPAHVGHSGRQSSEIQTSRLSPWNASNPYRQRRSQQNLHRRSRQIRKAHTSSASAASDRNPESYWPPLSPQQHPTPYDVLSHPVVGPYNKRRFTYLVKLYHPDSCPPSNQQIHKPTPQTHPSHLAPHIRLQRYQLLIQAHTLLSSPSKRAAYDSHGAGWASVPDFDRLRKENSARGWAAARADPSRTPFHCATWEDWEKWWAEEARRRQREEDSIFANDFTRKKRKSDPSREWEAWWLFWAHNRLYNDTGERQSRGQYLSNGRFIFAVATLAACGALFEIGRADRHGTSIRARLERVNEESLQELSRARRESRLCDSRAERVGKFLKERADDRVFGAKIYDKVSADQEPAGESSVQALEKSNQSNEISIPLDS